MANIFSELLRDAQAISDGITERAEAAARERTQLAERLAEIQAIEDAAEPLAERMWRLRQVYDNGADKHVFTHARRGELLEIDRPQFRVPKDTHEGQPQPKPRATGRKRDQKQP